MMMFVYNLSSNPKFQMTDNTLNDPVEVEVVPVESAEPTPAPTPAPVQTPNRIAALASDIALAESQRVEAEAAVEIATNAIANAETDLQALKDNLVVVETAAVAAKNNEISELKEARDIIDLRIKALEA